ncbi:MAG: hypothetical protein ACWGSQ_17000, partial [Longimicrobiales bacterium]
LSRPALRGAGGVQSRVQGKDLGVGSRRSRVVECGDASGEHPAEVRQGGAEERIDIRVSRPDSHAVQEDQELGRRTSRRGGAG